MRYLLEDLLFNADFIQFSNAKAFRSLLLPG